VFTGLGTATPILEDSEELESKVDCTSTSLAVRAVATARDGSAGDMSESRKVREE